MFRFIFRLIFRAPKKPKKVSSFREPRIAPLRWPEFEPVELIDAKVLTIIDGDTVMVRFLGERHCVRLDSIDCPEGDQPWGYNAKFGLIRLIGGREVQLETHGLDIFGRTLATIYVKQGSEFINVNEKMVACGHAWVMRRYYKHLSRDRKLKLNQLVRWAKRKQVGLWKAENPVPPWHWRKYFSNTRSG